KQLTSVPGGWEIGIAPLHRSHITWGKWTQRIHRTKTGAPACPDFRNIWTFALQGNFDQFCPPRYPGNHPNADTGAIFRLELVEPGAYFYFWLVAIRIHE